MGRAMSKVTHSEIESQVNNWDSALSGFRRCHEEAGSAAPARITQGPSWEQDLHDFHITCYSLYLLAFNRSAHMPKQSSSVKSCRA